MSSSTNIWPTAPIEVDDQIKQLITRFFDNSDSTDTTSGKLFADELFTEDGHFKTHETCVFNGRDEIAASREHNSPLILSRSHTLHQVFAANSPATDLLVLGLFVLNYKGGIVEETEFSARFEIRKGEKGYRIKKLRVWTDPTGMFEAMKKVKALEEGQN